MATRLARDGLSVGVVDLDERACAATVQAVRSAGGDAVAVAADVDETAMGAAVSRVVTELGPPTVLVHNAGLGWRDVSVAEMSMQQWDTVTGVSRGAFFFVWAVSSYMITAGWGQIESRCRVLRAR